MLMMFSAFSFDKDDDIVTKVQKAASNEDAFAALCKEFEKHMRFVASQVTGRYISESDDEWSVTLLAFYEAVGSYRSDKGSFVSFSDMVIKRRLIDNIRSQSRTAREVATDMGAQEHAADEDAAFDPTSSEFSKQAVEISNRDREARDIRWEIEGLNKVLVNYGISFADLPDVSPKAEKTKKACARAISAICGDEDIMAKMKQNGRLPAKDVSKAADLPLKLLDKHRKYIIAVVEIMTGDYPELQAYAGGVMKMA